MTEWTVSLVLDAVESPAVPCSTTASARRAMLSAVAAMDAALGTVTKPPALSAPTWQRESQGIVYAGNVTGVTSYVLVSAVRPEMWPGNVL